MKLTVQHKNNQFAFEVAETEIVGGLMPKISEKLKCDKDDFILKHGVLILLDTKILSKLDIVEGEVLQIEFKVVPILACVTNDTGAIYNIEMKLDATVLEFKKSLKNKHGIDENSIDLSFAGKKLKDEDTLFSGGITKNSSIQMISKLRGGNEK